MEKHIVKLNDTQRQELEDCINKGKSEAYKIKHANILLKADVNGPGERIHLNIYTHNIWMDYPLEWFINRYKITPPEKNNGILNDTNAWFDNRRDLISAIERIIHVSVESTRIIKNLPTSIYE